MPPQRSAPRLGQADYAVHEIPWVQLGLSANAWTRQKLRTILDCYKVHYRPNALKTALMTHLAKLNERLLRTKGRQLTAHDRIRILHEQGMGARATYDPHMAEVLRYAVNYGSHNGDLEEFPYVQAMIDAGPGPRDARLRSEFSAIVADFEIYSQAYRARAVRDIEDDAEFGGVYGRMRRPQKCYTAEGRDYLMSRLLPRVRARYVAEFGVERDEEEEDDGMSEISAISTDEEERSESESESGSSVTDTTSSSYASDTSEEAIDRNKERSAKAQKPQAPTKRIWSVDSKTSKASSNPKRYCARTPVQLPEPPETPLPKSKAYARSGLGRCPRCEKLGTIIKTRYHVATICKSNVLRP